jgi:hypothetical protein
MRPSAIRRYAKIYAFPSGNLRLRLSSSGAFLRHPERSKGSLFSLLLTFYSLIVILDSRKKNEPLLFFLFTYPHLFHIFFLYKHLCKTSWYSSSLKLTVTFFSAFLPTFKYKVAEKEYCIFGFHPLVMFTDNHFIHLLNRLKRSVAISDDIGMREVIIRCPPVVHFFITLFAPFYAPYS